MRCVIWGDDVDRGGEGGARTTSPLALHGSLPLVPGWDVNSELQNTERKDLT